MADVANLLVPTVAFVRNCRIPFVEIVHGIMVRVIIEFACLRLQTEEYVLPPVPSLFIVLLWINHFLPSDKHCDAKAAFRPLIKESRCDLVDSNVNNPLITFLSAQRASSLQSKLNQRTHSGMPSATKAQPRHMKAMSSLSVPRETANMKEYTTAGWTSS